MGPMGEPNTIILLNGLSITMPPNDLLLCPQIRASLTFFLQSVATDRYLQQVNVKGVRDCGVLSPKREVYTIPLPNKAQRCTLAMGWKDCESQRWRVSSRKEYFPNTTVQLHTWMWQHAQGLCKLQPDKIPPLAENLLASRRGRLNFL